MTNAFLITDDDIIICDPEAEYYPLVKRLQGQVIRLSPTSPHYVNPMDMPLVNVRREYIFMLPLCYRVGKLPPDLMGFLIVHFPRRKGLYQVKG